MKAAELYRRFDATVAPALEAAAFVRQRGRVSRWLQRSDRAQLYLQFRTNPKYPWQPWSGGEYLTEAFYVTDQGAKWQDIETTPRASLDFFGYWSDDEYQALIEINRHVLQKIKAIDHDELLEQMASMGATMEAVRSFHETGVEILEMSLDTATLRSVLNPGQHYLDEEDVTAWATLTARMLPVVLAGVEASPRTPFAG